MAGERHAVCESAIIVLGHFDHWRGNHRVMSKRWTDDCRVMRRHVPEYRNPQLYRCEYLKTRVVILPEIYN